MQSMATQLWGLERTARQRNATVTHPTSSREWNQWLNGTRVDYEILKLSNNRHIIHDTDTIDLNRDKKEMIHTLTFEEGRRIAIDTQKQNTTATERKQSRDLIQFDRRSALRDRDGPPTIPREFRQALLVTATAQMAANSEQTKRVAEYASTHAAILSEITQERTKANCCAFVQAMGMEAAYTLLAAETKRQTNASLYVNMPVVPSRFIEGSQMVRMNIADRVTRLERTALLSRPPIGSEQAMIISSLLPVNSLPLVQNGLLPSEHDRLGAFYKHDARLEIECKWRTLFYLTSESNWEVITTEFAQRRLTRTEAAGDELPISIDPLASVGYEQTRLAMEGGFETYIPNTPTTVKKFVMDVFLSNRHHTFSPFPANTIDHRLSETQNIQLPQDRVIFECPMSRIGQRGLAATSRNGRIATKILSIIDIGMRYLRRSKFQASAICHVLDVLHYITPHTRERQTISPWLEATEARFYTDIMAMESANVYHQYQTALSNNNVTNGPIAEVFLVAQKARKRRFMSSDFMQITNEYNRAFDPNQELSNIAQSAIPNLFYA